MKKLLFILSLLPALVFAQGKLGLPKYKSGIIIEHKGYSVNYDTISKNPTWVAWVLDSIRVEGEFERSQRFMIDPLLPPGAPSATHYDYTGSGYDRGHMCPAADNAWDEDAMYESFYTTNICPQTPRLNRGIWKVLEDQSRLDCYKGDLYIVCGPIYNRSKEYIGDNDIRVPYSFFKVIYYDYKKPFCVGYLFTNDFTTPVRTITSVKEIEKITRINFFPNLKNKRLECVTHK